MSNEINDTQSVSTAAEISEETASEEITVTKRFAAFVSLTRKNPWLIRLLGVAILGGVSWQLFLEFSSTGNTQTSDEAALVFEKVEILPPSGNDIPATRKNGRPLETVDIPRPPKTNSFPMADHPPEEMAKPPISGPHFPGLQSASQPKSFPPKNRFSTNAKRTVWLTGRIEKIPQPVLGNIQRIGYLNELPPSLPLPMTSFSTRRLPPSRQFSPRSFSSRPFSARPFSPRSFPPRE